MEHKLKTWDPYFTEVVMNRKRYEVRLGDIEVEPGDVLVLEEYLPKHGYTGNVARRTVTHAQVIRPSIFWSLWKIWKHGLLIIEMKR